MFETHKLVPPFASVCVAIQAVINHHYPYEVVFCSMCVRFKRVSIPAAAVAERNRPRA